MEQKNKNPNCRQCEYFYVTWDNNKPYGCKAFGFKSQRMPSVEVFEASGKLCLKFKLKNKNNV